MIWEERSLVPQGSIVVGWFDGTWIIIDGTNDFLFRMPSLGPW